MVYYLSRFEYLRYRYKICNPMPEIINNTPKAIKPPPKSARAEMRVNTRPDTKQTPGKLRVKALIRNLNILPYLSLFSISILR
ncbi:hypothetical protein ES703_68125 [subsurface metagenome]